MDRGVFLLKCPVSPRLSTVASSPYFFSRGKIRPLGDRFWLVFSRINRIYESVFLWILVSQKEGGFYYGIDILETAALVLYFGPTGLLGVKLNGTGLFALSDMPWP